MRALLRLPGFRGATHADDHDNRSRHRQVGQGRGTGWASQSQITWCRIKTHGSATGRIGGACRGPPRCRGVRGPALAAGSICAIAATLNDQREAVQLAKLQSLNFGERDGKMSDRATLAASYGPRSRPAARISSSACWMNAAPSRRHPSFRSPCEKYLAEPRCKTTAAAPTAAPES